jgi:hypothetical protein
MSLIGITNCKKLEDYRQSNPPHRWRGPRPRGGRRCRTLLEGLEGLLLTGGEDVSPARYGEATHPSVVDVDPARDEFEVSLIAAARSRGLPILRSAVASRS